MNVLSVITNMTFSALLHRINSDEVFIIIPDIRILEQAEDKTYFSQQKQTVFFFHIPA